MHSNPKNLNSKEFSTDSSIIHNLTIQSLAYKGSGVGRHAGKVIFGPYTVPGDKVHVKIVKDKRSHSVAEIIEFVEYSSQRCKPVCVHFGTCGGCHWLNIPYDLQLYYKE